MQTKTIALRANVPPKFLEAIVVDLRNAGLLNSKRGVLGGHHLARRAEDIMLGDVVRAVDGSLAPLRCASVSQYQPCDDCADVENCAIRRAMRDVRIAISDVLDQRSILTLLPSRKSAADDIFGDSVLPS